MEEAKAYSESGILELYVLGQLNAQEQAEVEAMASKHLEIKQEIETIEIAMEQYALHHAIVPSQKLESSILEKITPIEETAPVKDAVIIPLNNSTYEGKIRLLRIALVACVAMLVFSIFALFNAHDQLGNAKDQITSLSLDKEKFTSTVAYMKKANADLQKISAMVNDPDWKTVKLSGTKMDPNAHLIVYWHVTDKQVIIDNSKMRLPANDKSDQYQLWALVNGKPVDLGVFDVKPNTPEILVNMKEISAVQTFAVTLEKRGGSETPTMDQMIVAGNVSI
ncbi:anti-sigma-K factor RskA [Pedobacter sp. CG_S7]|uniref:anti-sigma factor n=1 Tax=Pedobacter sp. CG_S7 TaxID=3143930 RepID=UPI003391ED5A